MKYITPEIKYLKYLDEGCEKVVFDLDKYVLKVYKNTNIIVFSELELSKLWYLFREYPYKVFGDNVLPEILVGYITEKTRIGNCLLPVTILEKVTILCDILNEEESQSELNKLKNNLDLCIKESKDLLGIYYTDCTVANIGIKDNKCVLVDMSVSYRNIRGKLF